MKDISKLSKSERALILAQREYHRKWRAEHKDNIRLANERFYVAQAKKAKKKAV